MKSKETDKKQNNISIRNISNKKAKRLLNWKPKISLVEGLKSLISNIGGSYGQ